MNPLDFLLAMNDIDAAAVTAVELYEAVWNEKYLAGSADHRRRHRPVAPFHAAAR